MKIWLDDVRCPPNHDWVWVVSVNDAKRWIDYYETDLKPNGETLELSLDHDLGEYAYDGGDGIKLMDWLAERGTTYPVELHTMNPVGRDNMVRMIKRYWSKKNG